ncbi:DUF6173 family protein [Celeribacter arenosi]|uniref:Uncharacterized protein n=1 Tax=Celeribacter arenosi TaxID=792649 RepID=A0ABP7K1P1_9RHOB
MTGDNRIETAAEAYESEALPQARVVHLDPDAPRTAEEKPLPEAMSKKPVAQKSPAEWAYERLILYIKNFEETLDNEHEVAMGFAGSETGVMRIEGLGFFDPDIVTFYGTDQTGTKAQLIQHVTQLSVMLRALPKNPDTETPMRIGFRLANDLAGDPVDEDGRDKQGG